MSTDFEETELDAIDMHPVDVRKSLSAGPTPESCIRLEEFRSLVSQLIIDSETHDHFLQSLVVLTARFTNAIWCGIVEKNSTTTLISVEHNQLEAERLGVLSSSIIPVAEKSIATSRLVTSRTELDVLATSIATESSRPWSICLLLNSEGADIHSFGLVLELAACQIQLSLSLESAKQEQWRLKTLAAICELGQVAASKKNVRLACESIVQKLRHFTGCELVALSLQKTAGAKTSRLEAISGVTKNDKESDLCRAIESALNESYYQQCLVDTSQASSEAQNRLSHKHVIDHFFPGCYLVSAPIMNVNEDVMGAITFLYREKQSKPVAAEVAKLRCLAEVCSSNIGDTINLQKVATQNPLLKTAASVKRTLFAKPFLAFTAVLVVLFAILMIPVPYYLNGTCTIEPINKHYVSASFNGVVAKIYVKPGDIVRKGDVIAKLDDRELRLKLTELKSRLLGVRKSADVAHAEHDPTAIKLAELEAAEVESQIAVVESKIDRYELKSEIDGIVLVSALEDVLNAPVAQGDLLFQIAPASEYKVVANFPQADVRFLTADMNVNVSLEGIQLPAPELTVHKIRPETAIFQNAVVVQCEAKLVDKHQQIRPGMSGKVTTFKGNKTLAWVLFHRPWERACAAWF